VKELLTAVFALLVLIVRHLIHTRMADQERLEAAMKAQESLDQAATQMLTDGLDMSRSQRRKMQELQDAMDED
jgi:hypothetical protein